MASSEHNLNQIRKLLPLDDESLKQVLDYSGSLPQNEAAENLKTLLGDSPAALDFIASFNARRTPASSAAASAAPPAGSEGLTSVPKPGPRKKKAGGIKKLPPVRQVEGFGDASAGVYKKRDVDDYMPQRAKRKDAHTGLFALEPEQNSSQTSSLAPTPPSRTRSPANKTPPSAAGRLISDTKSRSNSPAPKPKATKVSIAGGTPMHGPSTALSDLDNAIRELEVQTNPTFSHSAEQNAKRKCNCMATRHELLAAAPNCQNCGKIICVKEGIGPCTFCKTPLLSGAEIDSMIRVLREERGKEKMSANNASHRRADVAATPRPFTKTEQEPDNASEKLAEAMQHRDKLLNYQAHNAKRTRVHDEAADFETPSAGLNAWATPAERAMQLRKQQKALREQEWATRPEWEKKKVVASLDLVGGKVVRRMAAVERPRTPEDEVEDNLPVQKMTITDGRSFGSNPLLGQLIKPVARVDAKGKGKETERTNASNWRRVQDSQEDNEDWILDGGSRGNPQKTDADEPASG
ncbi:zf-C2HC5-domain-containing protein [Microthyrium microscopicum]|uniref:Zf-C2HC5-domain-containing protein n=1 Tax=Microthyrium microscopicum TaxID=703497 RepID=A0A6A6UCR6_9PEZI|nr:zf-C2HC5-domain-containing protein [Microthyrium microscopicum]